MLSMKFCQFLPKEKLVPLAPDVLLILATPSE